MDHGVDTAPPVTPDRAARGSQLFLAAAVIVALVLRVVWARGHAAAIDQEGAEYARIAQNLLAGRGYVGIFGNGPALAFPPLYPILIAATSLLFGSVATAAHALNILFGAALVIPMHHLARDLYGGKTARVVSGLVGFHPILIAGAAATNAEGIHLTILMTALLWLNRWWTGQERRAAIATGALLGLAYLVRPEALGIALAVGAMVLLTRAGDRDRTRTGRSALALAGSFALIVAPYAAYLSWTTGQFRVQTVLTFAYHWAIPREAGKSQPEAATVIGPDLSDRGVDMPPNVELLTGDAPPVRAYLGMLIREVQGLMPVAQRTLFEGHALGSPVLVVLIGLGLWGSGWTRQRWEQECLLGVALLILLAGQSLWFRDFYSLLGVVFLWAGHGADELGEWGRQSFRAVVTRSQSARLAGDTIGWGAIGVVVMLSWREVRGNPLYAPATDWDRERAGEWLSRQEPVPTRIMDAGSQVAFYAGADLSLLPFTDADRALQYVARRGPDFVVLGSRSIGQRPYTRRWFDEGIPDGRAALVYDAGEPDGERIKIYRWSPPGPSELPAESLPRQPPGSRTP
jgi:4-amino-4-deoxy-L-arabinose transferase-like glycosyltransferase